MNDPPFQDRPPPLAGRSPPSSAPSAPTARCNWPCRVQINLNDLTNVYVWASRTKLREALPPATRNVSEAQQKKAANSDAILVPLHLHGSLSPRRPSRPSPPLLRFVALHQGQVDKSSSASVSSDRRSSLSTPTRVDLRSGRFSHRGRRPLPSSSSSSTQGARASPANPRRRHQRRLCTSASAYGQHGLRCVRGDPRPRHGSASRSGDPTANAVLRTSASVVSGLNVDELHRAGLLRPGSVRSLQATPRPLPRTGSPPQPEGFLPIHPGVPMARPYLHYRTPRQAPIRPLRGRRPEHGYRQAYRHLSWGSSGSSSTPVPPPPASIPPPAPAGNPPPRSPTLKSPVSSSSPTSTTLPLADDVYNHT